MDSKIWIKVITCRGGCGRDYNPERDFPSTQRNYTEKTLKKEENFIYNLIYKMYGIDSMKKNKLTYNSDVIKAYRYLDCVTDSIKGKMIDLKKAYWDLGIYELTKIYG